VVKYQFSKTKAGAFMGIPWYFMTFFGPFLGKYVDRFGKRCLLIIGSNIILTIAFTISLLSPECNQCYNEVYSLSLFSIGYSIFATVIWACIPLIVSEDIIGLAFGVAECI